MSVVSPQLVEALRERYVLERELGHGGMATVYLARDLRHDRPVAFKVLHQELAATLGPERFLREIRTAARLQHPHILSVHDSGETAGLLWFTMPYVEGESLRGRLTRERQLPLGEALRITREAAQALRYAHDHGVIHRDIKPDNLLLTEDGSTLVADFGIARALALGEDRLTETGLAIGTPAYMSPEQASGSTDLDGRSDVYSLGCVLYEMLAGEPPFSGPTPQAIMAKRLATSPPSLSVLRRGIPASIVAAVDRALATVPADRFSSVSDFAQSLAADAAPPPVRRRRIPVPLLAAVPLFAIVYLGVRLSGLLGESSLVAEGVLAPRDQLVLTAFVDKANDSSLAAAVTEAFRVDFAQSRLVGLASPDRVLQTLRLMERPDTTRMTPALGREVALRTGLKAVLSGEVTRLGDGYMISAQVVGADSGQVLAAHRETASGASEIIPAVDRLSRNLRRAIGESLRGVSAGAPLEAVTTGSLAALKWYSQGARLSDVGHYAEAIPLYERAVQVDTAFAMAWRAIGVDLWNLGREPARQAEAITRAYTLRDRLTERERYGAEAQYFEWVLGDRARARAAYQALLAIHPDDSAALTNLGLLTWFDGDYELAAELAARAIESDPHQQAPYTNLVDAQVTLGRFAAAETTLALWRSRIGGDAAYEVQVGLMASVQSDYDSASRAFRRAHLAQGATGHAPAAIWVAGVASTRGRLNEARRFARFSFESDRAALARTRWALFESWSELYYGLDRNRVVKRLDSLRASPGYRSINVTNRPFADFATLYVMAGELERGRAVFEQGERELQQLGANGQRLVTRPIHQMLRNGFHGAMALQAGQYEEAAERFYRAWKAFNGTLWLPELALALDRGGAADSALVVYERYLESNWNFRLWQDQHSLGPALRRVGELYERKGDRSRAIDSYQKFVSLWRDSDPALQPQVTEVRRRLAQLTGES
jgi:serine/threonine-protein kinase